MTYNRINTNDVKPEMDFDQIQNDLAKFKNHTAGQKMELKQKS